MGEALQKYHGLKLFFSVFTSEDCLRLPNSNAATMVIAFVSPIPFTFSKHVFD
jgi:hypothetical protein